MELQELQSLTTSQVSFYKKAMVDVDTNTLYSYGIKIATLTDDNKVKLLDDYEDDYSQTTKKHLNEFIRQYVQHIYVELYPGQRTFIGIGDIRKALAGDMILDIE